MKKIISLCICILLSSACSSQPSTVTRSSFMLDTSITITLYDGDEDILNECFKKIKKYEKIFSKTNKKSELYQINHRSTNTLEISDDLAKCIESGLYYSQLSDGNFDISVAPLTDLWDFTSNDAIIPNENEITTACQKIDYTKIHLDGNTLSFEDESTQIDLGGIAKGYIADEIKAYLLKQDVTSALIDLGGNILCVNKKLDDSNFIIGVQKPFTEDTLLALSINDKSVVTSGIYQRYFEIDGQIYHHILNPKTGYSFQNELDAVTIISNKSLDGDALSTITYTLGLDKGKELIDSLDDTYAIFVLSDGTIEYSEGAQMFINDVK